MQWCTEVSAEPSRFHIEPEQQLLFVGSCFADSIGSRFVERKLPAVVNPYGVMYNPVSLLHTIERTDCRADVAILTLGTNHVYRLKETGEIVDNCQKRPQKLFDELQLGIDECVKALDECVCLITSRMPSAHVVLTVSPIRYAKYGFHGSRLSKAVLLLAADRVCRDYPKQVSYFPAYEIMNDELRDYRFHKADMLHPTEQAIDYIFSRFADCFFSPRMREYMADIAPVLAALGHKPFRPDSDEYRKFAEQTARQVAALRQKWPMARL